MKKDYFHRIVKNVIVNRDQVNLSYYIQTINNNSLPFCNAELDFWTVFGVIMQKSVIQTETS